MIDSRLRSGHRKDEHFRREEYVVLHNHLQSGGDYFASFRRPGGIVRALLVRGECLEELVSRGGQSKLAFGWHDCMCDSATTRRTVGVIRSSVASPARNLSPALTRVETHRP